MARYIGPSCRLCRREGQKLYLKGERCYSNKCAIDKRGYAPGTTWSNEEKTFKLWITIKEKQKAKRFYGLLESQFRSYFEKAEKQSGITGENLLRILETRLDNVVYRMGFANSRKEARQLVRHGHFIVNGKKVNVPSYLVSLNDVIKAKEKSASLSKLKEMAETTINVPNWLQVNRENLEGKIVSLPTREDIDIPIAEHLIVELYSK
jgi:small subunit ribosomal protein S4